MRRDSAAPNYTISPRSLSAFCWRAQILPAPSLRIHFNNNALSRVNMQRLGTVSDANILDNELQSRGDIKAAGALAPSTHTRWRLLLFETINYSGKNMQMTPI